MNDAHLQYLASDDWKVRLDEALLPWIEVLGGLGDDVLEVGPGPGLTTDILRTRAPRVTVVELDTDLAAGLAVRLAGTNVQVVHGDATATGLEDDRFSAVACFSMLHHVPSGALQDALFAEAHRVLRPGGMLVGIDVVDNPVLRELHQDDVFVPVDPATFADRLTAAGFSDVTVEPGEWEMRFLARK